VQASLRASSLTASGWNTSTSCSPADAWNFATTLSSATPDEQRRIEMQRDAEVAALGTRNARPHVIRVTYCVP